MKKINRIFAEKLRLYRANRSQKDVAAEFNISQTHFSALETGTRSPSYDLLCQIIEKTGKGPSYWFDIDNSDVDMNTKHYQVSKLNITNIEHMSFPEIIALQAQIRVYLDNIKEPILDYDRRMLSDILAACQRAVDSEPNQRIKVI